MGAVSVGDHQSSENRHLGEERYGGPFLHTLLASTHGPEEGFYIPLSLTQERLWHSHGSDELEFLTWTIHIHNTHSLRTSAASYRRWELAEGCGSVWGMCTHSVAIFACSTHSSPFFLLPVWLFFSTTNPHNDVLSHVRLSTMESDEHEVNPLKPKIIFLSFIPTSIFVTV